MAEYYTKAESDAKYAATSHTHALEDMGGNELPADRVAIPDAAAPLFENAYTLDEALYSVADQLAGKAASDHTHENLTVTPAAHTHAQSEVTGLEARLTEIEADITALQSSIGPAEVTPMVVASMHLGKLDNNSGAEVTSASRICSDPFAVENGKSYWQVNDKAVNMYVLIYDADEMFLAYLGNFASGAEIAVDNASAAYMRLSSLVGEYDLTNEFRIYDVDPNAAADTEEEAFTQADADLLYAPIAHTHTEYAAAEHTHDYAAADHTHTGFAAAEHTHALDTHDIAIADDSSVAFATTDTLFDALENLDNRIDGRAPLSHIHTNYAETDHTHTASEVGAAAASHTHTADDITGLPSSVDAYSKTEADSRFAAASHTHDGYAAADHSHTGYATTAALAGKADANHTHGDYLTEDEAVDAFAPLSHTHNYASSGHTHTASEVGAAAATHTHTPASIGAAAASHSHSEYAAANHGHSGYASSGHSHTPSEVGAVPATGGTFTGEVTIPYGLNTGTIAPFDAGSYSIGSSDNRYYSTYLRVNPNVSSDLRCKRDIVTMDIDALAAFVEKLAVVSYNYKDDAADEAKRIGLIAQDVVAADPTIAKGCIEQDEKGFYSLRAADLVFPLIAAVQALTKRVEELEGK